MPEKVYEAYQKKLLETKAEIALLKRTNADISYINDAQKKYYAIRKQYIDHIDTLLAESKDCNINLSKPENINIIHETLTYWEKKRIENYCFCVMSNHVHWVFKTLEKDENGKSVYLEDIMHSVKLFTARRINANENLKGQLWHKESFDTTIRDYEHLYNTIEYTLNNPVKANLVKDRMNWKGNFNFDKE